MKPHEEEQLLTFVEEAAAVMRKRMRDGATKFGALSWRSDPYSDKQNHERLERAVSHLRTALFNEASEEEVAKRAADVANQAFMFADPKRNRRGKLSFGFDGPAK